MHCPCSRCSSCPAMPWSWLLQVPWSCCCRLRCNLRLHCFGGLCGYIDFLHLPLPFIFGMSLADAVYGLPLCMLCAAWSCYMAALCYAQHCRVLSSLPDLCRNTHVVLWPGPAVCEAYAESAAAEGGVCCLNGDREGAAAAVAVHRALFGRERDSKPHCTGACRYITI